MRSSNIHSLYPSKGTRFSSPLYVLFDDFFVHFQVSLTDSFAQSMTIRNTKFSKVYVLNFVPLTLRVYRNCSRSPQSIIINVSTKYFSLITFVSAVIRTYAEYPFLSSKAPKLNGYMKSAFTFRLNLFVWIGERRLKNNYRTYLVKTIVSVFLKLTSLKYRGQFLYPVLLSFDVLE